MTEKNSIPNDENNASLDDEVEASNNEEETSNKEEFLDEASESLKLANEEIQTLKSKLVEAQADFENIKKRIEKEKLNAVNFANESFARDLLSVIDALEMALNSSVDEENEQAIKLKEGVSLTIESFKQTLLKHGVKMIETEVGGEFDPELHSAMSYIESDEISSGLIAQIYQNGWLYNERILRPAMVLIAK